ncbi:MAG: hypothetical protein ACXVEU_12150 [Nocardioidaceae bacterium]
MTTSAPLQEGQRPDSAVVDCVEPQPAQATENGGRPAGSGCAVRA